MQGLLKNLISKRASFHKDVLLFQIDAKIGVTEVYSPALLQCATALRGAGVSVEYVKYSAFGRYYPDERAGIIRAYSPFLCLFAADLMNLPKVLRESGEIKSRLPHICVGVVADFALAERISADPRVDLAFSGDVDCFLPGFVDEIRRGGRASFRERHVHAEAKEGFAFPPLDFSFVSVCGVTPLLSSRGGDSVGAPSRSGTAKAVLYPAEKLEAEIGSIAGRAVHVPIRDPFFISDADRLERICSFLSKMDPRPAFSCVCDPCALSERLDFLPMLKGAGFKVVSLQVFTADPEAGGFYGIDVADRLAKTESVVRAASELGGLVVRAEFTAGSPFDSWSSFSMAADFCGRMSEIFPSFFEAGMDFFRPEPGSPAEGLVRPKDGSCSGCMLFTDDPDFLGSNDMSRPLFEVAEMTEDNLLTARDAFFKRMEHISLRQARTLPFDVFRFHRDLFVRHGVVTSFFRTAVAPFKLISDYCALDARPMFCRISEVSPEEIPELVPVRVVHEGRYVPGDGKCEISGYYDDVVLEGDDVEVYEFSAGKLKIRDIAKRIALGRGIDAEDAIENIIVPFYERMEKIFHVIFFR